MCMGREGRHEVTRGPFPYDIPKRLRYFYAYKAIGGGYSLTYVSLTGVGRVSGRIFYYIFTVFLVSFPTHPSLPTACDRAVSVYECQGKTPT